MAEVLEPGRRRLEWEREKGGGRGKRWVDEEVEEEVEINGFELTKKTPSLPLFSYLRSSSPMLCTRVWLYCTISENRNANVERLSCGFGGGEKESEFESHRRKKKINHLSFLRSFSTPCSLLQLPLPCPWVKACQSGGRVGAWRRTLFRSGEGEEEEEEEEEEERESFLFAISFLFELWKEEKKLDDERRRRRRRR